MMTSFIFTEGTENPVEGYYTCLPRNATPGPYRILVNSLEPCPHGDQCKSKTWSVAPFCEKGKRTKQNHASTHWHLAQGAKWSNGMSYWPYDDYPKPTFKFDDPA